MTKPNNNLVRVVSHMMVITLLGKFLGLLRDQFLASNYGMGQEAIAFLTASRIPRVFFDIVFASAISASFIPVFNECMKEKGREEAFQLSSTFITIVGILATIVVAIGMIFAPQLVQLFADGFSAETAKLTTDLLRILLPTTLFTAIAFSFVGILQSMGEFHIPAALSVVSNAVIIAYYIFLDKSFGIYGLTIAFLIGWSMQAVIQVPALIKLGYRYQANFFFMSKEMKKIGILMVPVMISTWIQPINILISTRFASQLLEGAAVTVIEYANTVYSIIAGIFILSIANVIFPELSRVERGTKFQETLSFTIESMMFLLIPMMVGLMCLSEPIIRLIYQRGKFGIAETGLTADALFYFSMGMLGFGLQTILSRAFYAQQNGKIPLLSGGISIGANVIGCVVLCPRMGVSGLALASAISSMISAIILFVPMQREHHIITKNTWVELIKMGIAAVVMAVLVVLSKAMIEKGISSSLVSTIVVVIGATLIGILVYASLCHLLAVSKMKVCWEFIKERKHHDRT